MEAADAEKLLRIVAMIDAMGERGAADALLSPLRHRLATLRPARPLRFGRLLFQPLDPVIVPGVHWQPDSPTIPRHALPPITQAVRTLLGDRVHEIDAMIAGCTSCDHAAITRIGSLLWPRAADAILAAASQGARAPANWVEAGLRSPLYAPMTHAIGTAWRWHRRLQAMEMEGHSAIPGADQEAIAIMVGGIAREPILTQAMMMAVLLARLPHVASLLQATIAALGTGPEQTALRAAGTRAIEGLTAQLEDGLEAHVSGTDLAGSGPEVRRLSSLLDELARHANTPARRASFIAMRQRLDASCRTRFQTGMLDDLLAPMQARTEALDGASQTQFENAARSLRGLETQARRIGGADLYDDMLGAASQAMQLAANRGVLTLPRQVRLIEILSGPEAAMALFDGVGA
jgi:hypothetical protein